MSKWQEDQFKFAHSESAWNDLDPQWKVFIRRAVNNANNIRAPRGNASGRLDYSEVFELLQKKHSCPRCQVDLDFKNFSIWYRLSLRQGGLNDLANVLLVCKACARTRPGRIGRRLTPADIQEARWVRAMAVLRAQGAPTFVLEWKPDFERIQPE